MWYQKNIERAIKQAKVLPLSLNNHYVIMSDCHRGNGRVYDNFLKNQHLYYAALQYYYERCYTYIELGDGEELWENRSREQIKQSHENVYGLFSKFQQENRLYRIYGNHDYALCKQCEECIILKDEKEDKLKICLLHGHQVDFLNSKCWKLARFLVRYVWRPLEQFGVNDPTRAASNLDKTVRTEKRLKEWAVAQDCVIIAGHTHRPRLRKEDLYYINSGSCVHPSSITALELDGYEITLVKWYMSTRQDRSLYVEREILEGPILLDI